MLTIARDVWAAFFLEKALASLRERFMAQTLEGSPPDSGFWTIGEQKIVAEQRSSFYSKEVRVHLGLSETNQRSDHEDFESRTHKLMEQAIWMTHHRLVELPFVGQEEYRDD
jgi:hypothetical protein